MIAIFCLIVSGCKNHENNPTNAANKAVSQQEKNVSKPEAIVTDSDEKEFAAAAVSAQLFRAFSMDTIPDASVKRPPVEIVTQSDKVIFKNINPAFDKGFYDEDVIDYFNLGFSSRIHKHLVYAGYYEYEELLLIDHITAKKDTLIGFPYFSPNAKRIVSYTVDPYGEKVVGDVEIFAVGKMLNKLFRQSFDFIPKDIRWSGNDIIIKAISIKDYTAVNSHPDAAPHNFIYKKISFK